ncbi:hypothetical protein [Saccharicrinis fermentans]|uniref:hypothetical protein n=1 Tax=Saccharicrinis fermentans TaxID=982 RepID=UPI0004BBD424|nr:hypothetical protein [Saccharicrinis fermentans]
MSVEMAIKEGFSEMRHSTSYGELKKSNEVTSFEAFKGVIDFLMHFPGYNFSPTLAPGLLFWLTLRSFTDSSIYK